MDEIEMSDDKDIYKEWVVRTEELWKERCRVALGEEYESLLRVVRSAKTALWQIDTLACAINKDGSRNEDLLRAILEITLENRETFKELPEGLLDE